MDLWQTRKTQKEHSKEYVMILIQIEPSLRGDDDSVLERKMRFVDVH